MSLLSYRGDCNGSSTACRTHCYIPVTTSVGFCSSDVSPTFGVCLPSSSYQGNLWLLDNCQEIYGGIPSYESPSCEPKTCTASWDSSYCSVPCNSPAVGKVCIACETTNTGPSPSCSPCTQTKGYVSHCSTPCRPAQKACQTLSKGSQCLGQLNCSPKSFPPSYRCRLGSLGYRRYQNLGFTPSGFSISCYAASGCPSSNYLMRNCQYSRYKLIHSQPFSCFSRNFRSLSCMPSTFPPLRYLCSGCRPLNCY
ncbi:keratin-associated protein 24-1 [Rousettus aegyptiacus]|uniref:Keratin-associated protein n=1 Tax=Rousettus aegyptiacus TaxID=9407 RepID=A0A7J8HRY5_ROUAE|nr:keratin-associated protein 24-1 [Rousettus aegyptiacus]KAF6474649.1 keratin associated protein 24-1 [Rousettus aegyptiacus]